MSLSAFFEYKAGHQIALLNEGYYFLGDGIDMNLNQFASGLNYWKKPGDVGVSPKPIAGNSTNSNQAVSTRYLQNGDYVRLKDVTLSYSLPQSCLSVLHLKGLKLYVSGLNLYCWNDVDYFDPEIGINGTNVGMYPLTKSVVGGIEVTF